MKKALSLALALVFVFALAIPAFAAESVVTPDGAGAFADKSGATTVTYNVAGTYTISIPADFSLNEAGAGTADISVSNVLIPVDKKLTVELATANYDNGNYLVNNTSKIPYTIKNGEAVIAQNTPFITVAAGTKAGATVSLDFAATVAAATLMGAHTDIITFTAKVVNAG